ncbi:hypothetical protein BOTNAR_0437g00080 [Botryotinia narcissicola]|uniref:Uncharacterized protein n=1 Tax=Botryotinia narcissicola TaxID=278944 RepID=A0A4Z1HKD7_9HELO|nr:hypothetical protein BOTNAR_0437g00080 [Botryotinia narcissicola]
MTISGFPLTQLLHFHVTSRIIQTRTSESTIPSKANHLQILTPLDPLVPTKDDSVYTNILTIKSKPVAKSDATSDPTMLSFFCLRMASRITSNRPTFLRISRGETANV